MSSTFWDIVHQVIGKADIIMMVLDSRLIDETINPEIERKVNKAGKELIYVLNKCDLVDKEKLEKEKKRFKHCVFMSATKHLGTTLLREEIMKIAKGEKVTVGVLGYPNTGKSSVINALCGAGGAKTAPISGYTKHIQLLKASAKIYMLDTPGVLPYQEANEAKHLMIGSKNPEAAKDPVYAAEALIEKFKERVCTAYEIDAKTPSEDILTLVSEKLSMLKKGNVPDLRRAAVKVLHDWQKGKII